MNFLPFFHSVFAISTNLLTYRTYRQPGGTAYPRVRVRPSPARTRLCANTAPDACGRPALFATTPQFLNDLGLKSLSALPPLKGETPQAQEFELDFSDEKIRENLGKDAAPASLLRSEATTASEKNELKRTAVETAEVTNDDEESKA